MGDQRGKPLLHLVERWKAGVDSEENFQELHRRFERRIYQTFPFWVPHETRLELTQEVFSRVIQYRESCRVDAFEAWLLRIAKTTFLKWRQRESRLKRRGQEVSWDDLGAGPTEAFTASKEGLPLDRLLDQERSEALQRAIAELPDRMRQVLLLRTYQGLSEAEVAATLRIAEGTVKAHLAGARKRLRDRLSRGDGNV